MLKLLKILDELEVLSNKEKDLFLSLSSFQLKVISHLKRNNKEKVNKLICIKDNSSRAQKYRYINKLLTQKICIVDNENFLKLK